MNRIKGWESRLARVIADAAAKPYVLGEHDCFRVACSAVEALTGVDYWADWGKYTTKREAMRLLASRGARTFEDAFTWLFKTDPVPAVQARRGDICSFQTLDGEKHLGVCLGVETAVTHETQLMFIKTRTCLCAWRIG